MSRSGSKSLAYTCPAGGGEDLDFFCRSPYAMRHAQKMRKAIGSLMELWPIVV